MQEWFKDIPMRRKTLEQIDQANRIIAEYQAEGLTLTLRQLYYQFVARDLLPNSQRSYDSLGRNISNARLAGLVDWGAIEDRTRFLRGRQTSHNPQSAIRSLLRRYCIDMWKGQDARLEVWIEKDALLGVIERVCFDHDVDYFACRGYVSQSELYEAGKRIQQRRDEEGQETVVIHLGDHDPSGIDMTRDNDDRLCMFADGYVEVKRIALNFDQIEQYGPPPNPTKLTDSRAEDYIAQHGYSSWELDALEPRVLRSLIQEQIDLYRDPDVWAEREALLEVHKNALRSAVSHVENYVDKQQFE